MDLSAPHTADYEFLDAGDGGRPERFGPYVFTRPSPVALWRREHPDLWQNVVGVYHRSSEGGGHWTFNRNLPSSWLLTWGDLAFNIKPTGFGHMGFFPEHTCHWKWVSDRIQGGGGGVQCPSLVRLHRRDDPSGGAERRPGVPCGCRGRHQRLGATERGVQQLVASAGPVDYGRCLEVRGPGGKARAPDFRSKRTSNPKARISFLNASP